MIKKILLFVIFVCSMTLFAQKDPFTPPNAITMAQGGAFTAVASGYNAFYYNPAGFARKSEFTLLSMDVYGVLDRTLYQLMSDQLKQYSGTSYKGLESTDTPRAFDVNNIITSSQTSTLTTQASTIGTYLTTANTAAPGSVTTAFNNTVSANPTYAALLSGINMASPPSSLNELMPYLAPLMVKDPTLVGAFLNTFLLNVQTASSQSASTALVSASLINTTLTDINNNLISQFPSGNVNVGATIGIGYVGNGLGLGLLTKVDASIYTPEGKSLLAATGRVTNSISLIGGFGFNVWDGFSLGISLRPTILGYANISPIDIMAQIIPGLGSTQSGDIFATVFSRGIYKGFYVGIDVGALLDVGPFTFGLAIKDLIPFQITYSRYSDPMIYLQDLGNFKGAQVITDSYQVPWGKINIGVSWHPDLGSTSKIFDPRISIDMQDVLGFLRYSDTDINNALHQWKWLDLINVGAEINLLGFIALRGGFNQGAWTAGLGLRLFVVDINTAFSARYKDGFTSLNDFSEVGFSFEIALLRLK